MIQIEDCRACGRKILTERLAGIQVRTDYQPLDGPGALAAVLAGTTLRLVDTHTDGRPRTFRPTQPTTLAGLNTPDPAARPKVVADHRCPVKAQEAVSRAARVAVDPKGVPTPSAAPGTPSRAPSTPPSSSEPVSTAEAPVSDGRQHPCDECGKPVALDGPAAYAAIELGASVIWTIHNECMA